MQGTHVRPADQHLVTLDLRLGERVTLDEPGPILLALSDALAQASDDFRPSGRARWQVIDSA